MRKHAHHVPSARFFLWRARHKKNWLFIGAAEAGQRSARLFTIIENCRRLRINPYDYLRDGLTRLPKLTNQESHTVTLAAWAKEKAEASKPALKLASWRPEPATSDSYVSTSIAQTLVNRGLA